MKLPSTQQVALIAIARDSRELPVRLTSQVAWSSSNPAVAKIVEDGMNGAMLVAVAVGSTVVTAICTPDPDDAGSMLTQTLAVEVIPGRPVTMTIEVGTPTEQTAPGAAIGENNAGSSL